MRVLITGGAGFIGSTIASAISERGWTPIVLDNLRIGDREFAGVVPFVEADVLMEDAVAAALIRHRPIEAVIHCAGLTDIVESSKSPGEYYKVNLGGTLALVSAMQRTGVKRLIYCSSSIVYADAGGGPVNESAPIDPPNVYGRTKAAAEMALTDLATAHGVAVLCFRYFNPVGADPKMRTGPRRQILAGILKAWQSRQAFPILGCSYDTRDGSAVRDYVHVWDLAQAHVLALERFDTVLQRSAGTLIVDLGTGVGTTVRELVSAAEVVLGERIRVVERPPRPGDSAGAFTNSKLAHNLFNWSPGLDLSSSIRSARDWFLRDQKRKSPT